jgi:hypothetical protein
MSWTETTEDGRTITHKPMSRSTRNLPTFGLWRWVMSGRPDHGEVTTEDKVLFTCIGCGIKLPSMEMSTIRVGALVRMEAEEQVSRDEWVQFTKVLPAQRAGKGCPACVAKYLDELTIIAKFNSNEDEIYTLRLQLAKMRGDTTPVAIPKPKTAWIDISDQVLEQKDGYMADIERRRNLGLLKEGRG